MTVAFDLDQAVAEFKRLAPEDARHIDRLARDARRCAPIQPPTDKPLELMSGPEKMRLGMTCLGALPVIFRWKNVPVVRYLARYRNAFLREALLTMTGDERVSTLVLIMLLAWRSRGDGGYVLGGTAGQSDAGLLTGGDYLLVAGFWGGASAVWYRLYLPLLLRATP